MLQQILDEYMEPGEADDVERELQEWCDAREIQFDEWALVTGQLMTRAEQETQKALTAGDMAGAMAAMPAAIMLAIKVGYEAAARKYGAQRPEP